MSMLVSVADFEIWLGQAVEDDLQAAQLLEIVSAQVVSYTGQQFELTTDDTVELRGTQDAFVWLPQRPVIDVTEVTIHSLWGQPITVPQAQLRWRRDGMLARPQPYAQVANGPTCYGAPWGSPSLKLDVTYSHGFAVIPADVQSVVLQAARRQLDNPQNIRTETIGHYSVGYNIAASGEPAVAAGYPVGITLTGAEKRVLNRYRRRTHMVSLR